MNRHIFITSFGHREEQQKKLKMRLAHFTDIPISVLSEANCETQWAGHPRWGVRNSNLAKAKAVLDNEGVILVLDDDMIPVGDFSDGFKLARRFGICMPVNPRCYAGVSVNIGADMSDKAKQEVLNAGMPHHQTGVNMGVVFADCGNLLARCLMEAYKLIQLGQPMRGTTAMDLAIWLTSFNPHFLSRQWCVCAADARILTTTSRRIAIPPKFLHGGHKAVLDWFYNAEYFKEVPH